MGIKTGEAIRAARTGAKLTQAALAKAAGLTPGEIGKAERGELELSKEAEKTEVEQLVDALLGDKWKKKVKRK